MWRYLSIVLLTSICFAKEEQVPLVRFHMAGLEAWCCYVTILPDGGFELIRKQNRINRSTGKSTTTYRGEIDFEIVQMFIDRQQKIEIATINRETLAKEYEERTGDLLFVADGLFYSLQYSTKDAKADYAHNGYGFELAKDQHLPRLLAVQKSYIATEAFLKLLFKLSTQVDPPPDGK